MTYVTFLSFIVCSTATQGFVLKTDLTPLRSVVQSTESSPARPNMATPGGQGSNLMEFSPEAPTSPPDIGWTLPSQVQSQVPSQVPDQVQSQFPSHVQSRLPNQVRGQLIKGINYCKFDIIHINLVFIGQVSVYKLFTCIFSLRHLLHELLLMVKVMKHSYECQVLFYLPEQSIVVKEWFEQGKIP